jgi:hypothetical protein
MATQTVSVAVSLGGGYQESATSLTLEKEKQEP